MGDVTPAPISTQRALDELCSALASDDFVAVDTEFQRETTYWPKLCLIQVATPTASGVVDPLVEELDLDPLYELLTDKRRTKVMHAARQDQEIFTKVLGQPLGPVFDSQIAAMALGYGDQISYNALIGEVLGIPIDKSSQFTDWTKRPLSDKQYHYALGDVVHLADAYLRIRSDLAEKNRMQWVEADNEALSDPGLYDWSPTNAWKRLSIRKRTPVYLALLNALATWREEQAQRLDRPRNRILRDDAIQAIAQRVPKDEATLLKLKPVPKNFARSRHFGPVIGIVKSVIENPDAFVPPLDPVKRLPPSPQGATEHLKALLAEIAERESFTPRLVANVADLKKIAAGEFSDVPAMTGWRYDVFGQHAERAIEDYVPPETPQAKDGVTGQVK